MPIAKRFTVEPKFNLLCIRSKAFNDCVYPYPTQSNLIRNIVHSKKATSKEVVDYADTAYATVHIDVLHAAAFFLEYKKVFGTEDEQRVYSSLLLKDFIERMISKRPLVFFNACDSHVLRGDTPGQEMTKEWNPALEEYMSYDEIKLSALMQASTWTVFINNGARNNCGAEGEAKTYIDRGVIVAAVGARFEKKGRMDWEECMASDLCTPEGGYGADAPESLPKEYRKIWCQLFRTKYFPTLAEAVEVSKAQRELPKPEQQFHRCGTKHYFNATAYTRRLQFTADMLLLEAQERAKHKNSQAYLHIVGFGLGVWQIISTQSIWFQRAFVNSLNSLALPNIGCIDFSWVDGVDADQIRAALTQNTHIEIRVSRRNPCDPLDEKYAGHTLVASFAWDGNSFPGNEYWLGERFLDSSSDPAAACCSLIPELLNPLVNEQFTRRVRVADIANSKLLSGSAVEQLMLELQSKAQSHAEKLLQKFPK